MKILNFPYKCNFDIYIYDLSFKFVYSVTGDEAVTVKRVV